MKKTASLGASLIATKGKAAPSPENEVSVMAPSPKREEGEEKRIAITVKLLSGMYQRMKVHGAANRQTNQAILEMALEEFLAKRGA